jgi:hypothetical protein
MRWRRFVAALNTPDASAWPSGIIALHSEAEDRIKATDFMDRLAVSNFRIALHGHIHKADTSIHFYDYSRKGRKLDKLRFLFVNTKRFSTQAFQAQFDRLSGLR